MALEADINSCPAKERRSWSRLFSEQDHERGIIAPSQRIFGNWRNDEIGVIVQLRCRFLQWFCFWRWSILLVPLLESRPPIGGRRCGDCKTIFNDCCAHWRIVKCETFEGSRVIDRGTIRRLIGHFGEIESFTKGGA